MSAAQTINNVCTSGTIDGYGDEGSDPRSGQKFQKTPLSTDAVAGTDNATDSGSHVVVRQISDDTDQQYEEGVGQQSAEPPAAADDDDDDFDFRAKTTQTMVSLPPIKGSVKTMTGAPTKPK